MTHQCKSCGGFCGKAERKPNGRPLVNKAHYESVMHPVAPEPDVSAHIHSVARELTQGLKDWQAGRQLDSKAAQDMRTAWLNSPAYARLRRANAIRAIDAHKTVVRHHAAKRRASQLKQSPDWADQAKIKAVYQHAKHLTESTGIAHHVDHIVPLTGRLVRGLHVHNNLQVITALENMKKHNKYEVLP